MDRPYCQITEKHQRIYKLKTEDKLSNAKIAKIVGCSTSYVVKSLIFTQRRVEAAAIASKNPDDLHNLDLPDKIHSALTYYGKLNSISELREFVKCSKLTKIEGIGRIGEQYVLDKLSKYTSA